MSGERPEGCPLCAMQELDDGVENFIVHRNEHAYLILNLFPYNNGHCMVVPTRHVELLTELTDDESAAVWGLTARTTDMLRDSLRAQGVNVGVNLGVAAGRSLEHLHVHIVPRWRGDTNFMPVTARTKVMVATLEDTYATFTAATAAWGSPAA